MVEIHEHIPHTHTHTPYTVTGVFPPLFPVSGRIGTELAKGQWHWIWVLGVTARHLRCSGAVLFGKVLVNLLASWIKIESKC